CVFFFQAEDGIRDFHVTGVQTCALPISPGWAVMTAHPGGRAVTVGKSLAEASMNIRSPSCTPAGRSTVTEDTNPPAEVAPTRVKIGRESCREREWRSLVGAF